MSTIPKPKPGILLARRKPKLRRGFALVITLSLMVLLTVIAVGLLTLSSISLRSSSQGDAMQLARSNARMALALAIGELQKSAGADQRITAPATIAQDSAPSWLTGVWNGQLPTAGQPVPNKDSNFLGYLASGNENSGTTSPDDVPDTTRGALLLGEGSLGTGGDPSEHVRAETVETTGKDGKPGGRYAWGILDEGMKAKVDLVRSETGNSEVRNQAAMGAPARVGIESIDGLDDYDWLNGKDQARMFSLPTASVMAGMPEMLPHQHEVTTVHRGLLTDSARGGLRKDLSRLLDDTRLPSDYATKRVYDDPQALNEDPNPYWAQILDFANHYKNLSKDRGNLVVGANVPSGYNPVYYDRRTRLTKTKPQAPRGQLVMPVVAKVQMMFSLVVQDAHGPWSGGTDRNDATKPDNYMCYMIYSPIVTLYNPYNVALSFDEMRLDFRDLPIGFRFYRNGQAQTTQMAHLNQLYVGHDTNSATPKIFGMNLRSSYTSGRAAPMVMQPGETIVFGESISGEGTWESAFDWQDDSKTHNITLAPGYPSPGIGYWVDWLTPDHMLTAADDKMGIFTLTRDRDNIDVEFGPLASTATSGTSLSVEVNLMRGSRKLRSGSLDLDFGGTSQLTTALNTDPSTVFPGNGQGIRLQRPYTGSELYQRPGTKLKDYTGPKYFALFSYYAKTTLESGAPAKPWISGGHTSSLSAIDITTEKMAVHPFEVALKRVAPGVKFPIDAFNRGKFFTGHSDQNGTRIAPEYEIPQIPLQNIAQLRHAGLSNQGFLPGATYTAGESFASAMIPANAVTAASTKDYPLLDHAWFANTALWDGYFFSTIASQGGPAMGSNKGAQSIAESFFNGQEPLLNPRIIPAEATTDADTIAAITGPDGYLSSAAHLMIDGAFNVNSTSVETWKAILSSLNQQDVDFFHLTDGAATGAPGTQSKVRHPFSRMRRANGKPVEDFNMLEARHGRWTGMRSLTDDEIDSIARNLVDEIKERGPFLSIAEFVNRTPGSDKQQALVGALQAAIDKTRSINDRFAVDSLTYAAGDLAGQGYAFSEAMEGMNAAGAPGYLTQGDILSSLGSSIAVRSDTFRIRSYGEALDSNDKIIAKAWCEAVVQRIPDFVDSRNTPETDVALLTESNQRFGRRFIVTSFRWLSPEEI